MSDKKFGRICNPPKPRTNICLVAKGYLIIYCQWENGHGVGDVDLAVFIEIGIPSVDVKTIPTSHCIADYQHDIRHVYNAVIIGITEQSRLLAIDFHGQLTTGRSVA